MPPSPNSSLDRFVQLAILAIVLTAVGAGGARAESAADDSWCGGGWKGWKILGPSPASSDLYNGLLWFGGAAGLSAGVDEKTRWTSLNDFDEDARDALRLDTANGREKANTASDALLGLSFGLPALALGKALFAERDCEKAYDMATDLAETIGLITLLTEATKLAAGRERPYGLECDGTPPSDARCGSDERSRSFFSGHAALAGAGAGLTCSYAIKRNLWGESTTARAIPCVLGAGLAATTGLLRVVGDKHWTTDVIVGLTVGAVVGYFDTWGPFDLLRFEVPSGNRGASAQGIIIPWTGAGVRGVMLSIRF
jgi:membrane-associated phospholipid phosphatase